MVARCRLLAAHSARSCLSVRTQPPMATGAPSQTSIVPYHTIPYHTIPYHIIHTPATLNLYHTIPYHTITPTEFYHTIPIPYTIPYHTHQPHHTIPALADGKASLAGAPLRSVQFSSEFSFLHHYIQSSVQFRHCRRAPLRQRPAATNTATTTSSSTATTQSSTTSTAQHAARHIPWVCYRRYHTIVTIPASSPAVRVPRAVTHGSHTLPD